MFFDSTFFLDNVSHPSVNGSSHFHTSIFGGGGGYNRHLYCQIAVDVHDGCAMVLVAQ